MSKETKKEQRTYVSLETLMEGVPHIAASPQDEGELMMLLRRPAKGERELLEEAMLDEEEGLIGDNWRTRGSSRTEDGSAHPEMQLTIMNTRVLALIEPDEARRPLAGDQLYLDMDLSHSNLPPGTRLSLGDAIIEVTAIPHTGCAKFRERFGPDALRFVNGKEGRSHHYRGINARVIQGGEIKRGQRAKKLRT